MTEEKLRESLAIKKRIDKLETTLKHLKGDKPIDECDIGIVMHSQSLVQHISDLVTIKDSIKQLIIEDLEIQREILETQFKEL